MARSLPEYVDTVIIGNGPSALILSYILHGHVPYYIGGHHDPILNSKLLNQPNLLCLAPDLHAHFFSSLKYSTQALPVNTLLDTLLRPNADTELNPASCIEWRHEPDRVISHVAIGETMQAGGQWAENPVTASVDIGTLSYAEQLSLPGYSYADHLAHGQNEDDCDFVRPSRVEFADYLRKYPQAVGISQAVYTGLRVDNVYRTAHGFMVGSLNMQCKHLVLASGTFTVNIPPPPLLTPLTQLKLKEDPLLVVGSGFSAADVIISAPPTRKIIHLFHWAPERRSSPLRACHHTAYPEYATVYRQMKIAALASNTPCVVQSPLMRRKSNPFFKSREWSLYEGFPNADILKVTSGDLAGAATVTLRTVSGKVLTREVGGLAYAVGRRGTLNYLCPSLHAEVLSSNECQTQHLSQSSLISGRTLRSKAELSLEVARDVFITGSLTGDSLIRHAVGGCVFAAGRIMRYIPPTYGPVTAPCTPRSGSPASDDVDGSPRRLDTGQSTPAEVTNGHADLHLDRRQRLSGTED